MPLSVTSPLSHPGQERSSDTAFHTVAKQCLRAICQMVGGGTRARSATGRTLWRTGECLLPCRRQRGAGPTQGRAHERPTL